MARLDTIAFNELAPTLRILADAKVGTEDFDWLRSPGNAEKLKVFLREAQGLKVASSTDIAYAARFAAAVQACGFSWWNQEQITAANFPGEVFEGGDYDLELQTLPRNSRGYNWNEIVAVVAEWARTDPTVLGGATAGDGLYFAAEVKAGHRDQPNGWVGCPASTSVDGGLLGFVWEGSNRHAHVDPRDCAFGDQGFVLLRKVRKP